MGRGNQVNAAAVVLNSGDSNGYGVIINLGRKGIPVLSVDSNPLNATFRSRYAKKVLCPDFKEDEGRFIEWLVDLGKTLKPKPVLFASGDLHVLAVLRHREELEKIFHLPMPVLDVAETLVDKVRFYRALEKYDVPHAKTYLPGGMDEVDLIAPKMEYPVIIKPFQSTKFVQRFHNKCLRAGDAGELRELYRKASCDGDALIIQNEIQGAERYLVYMYFDRNGEPVATSCYKKLRIQPIDYGNATACMTTWEPEAVELSRSVLKKLGYRGLAEAEIQRDGRDGRLKLVEINARSTTEARLSARCGMNMEYMAYCDMLGMPMVYPKEAKAGVIWIDILRDVVGVFSRDGYLAKKRMTLWDWLVSWKGEREYAFFAWDDPLPFATLAVRFVRARVRFGRRS